MAKYIAYVNRIDKVSGKLSMVYPIPLNGCYEEDVAIRMARRIAKTLKDNYIVSISKVREDHIGYVIMEEG